MLATRDVKRTARRAAKRKGVGVEHCDPYAIPGKLHLASLLGNAGRVDEAREVGKDVIRISPRFSLSRVKNFYPMPKQEKVEKFVDGLRKAGLPE